MKYASTPGHFWEDEEWFANEMDDALVRIEAVGNRLPNEASASIQHAVATSQPHDPVSDPAVHGHPFGLPLPGFLPPGLPVDDPPFGVMHSEFLHAGPPSRGPTTYSTPGYTPQVQVSQTTRYHPNQTPLATTTRHVAPTRADARSISSSKPLPVSGSTAALHNAQPSTSTAAQAVPSTSARIILPASSPNSEFISLNSHQNMKVVFLALFGCPKRGIAFALRKDLVQTSGMSFKQLEATMGPLIKATLEKLIEGSLGPEYQGTPQQVVAFLTGHSDYHFWRDTCISLAHDYDSIVEHSRNKKDIRDYVQKRSQDRIHKKKWFPDLPEPDKQVEDQKMENDFAELRANRKICGTEFANW